MTDTGNTGGYPGLTLWQPGQTGILQVAHSGGSGGDDDDNHGDNHGDYHGNAGGDNGSANGADGGPYVTNVTAPLRPRSQMFCC